MKNLYLKTSAILFLVPILLFSEKNKPGPLVGTQAKFWSLKTQLSNKALLSVVPVGFHLLAVSKSEPSKPNAQDGKIAFQYIELGDESGDSLPDWWNNLSDTSTLEVYNSYELTDDATDEAISSFKIFYEEEL